MNQIDVVLQGPFYPETQDVINAFQEQSWVESLIISTWPDQNIRLERVPKQTNLKILFQSDVYYNGVGNRNRQIKSSREGLKLVDSDVVIKARTDQIFQDLPLMYDFYQKHQQPNRIFTLGLYKKFPFHPRDHLFWGRTEDLKMLFDIPYDIYEGEADYTKCVRAETWIAQFYYARFFNEVAPMINSPQEYLLDGAPKLQEALDLDMRVKEQLFYSFPQIKMSWPRKGLSEYYYHVTAGDTEYWSEHD